jgi:hypothetical protein
MSRRPNPSIPYIIVFVLIGAMASVQAQQPKPIELDATTLAARTEAARSLVPLLEDVKKRATAPVNVQQGNRPRPLRGNSPPFSLSASASGRPWTRGWSRRWIAC